MKKSVRAVGLAAVLCTSAQADTLLGLYIGGQVWANQADGTFGEGEIDQASFNFDDENQGSYFVALEHPIPLIPNIKIASTTLDTLGSITLNDNFNFGGESFLLGDAATSVFNASYVDYTLYYEVFDNDLLTLDFGLTVRDIDTDISVTTNQTGMLTVVTTSNVQASGYVPMFYASTVVGLPFTGFNVFAEANFISYDDQTLYDYQVGVSYEVLDNLAVDLNFTLGYRAVKLELNDIDNLYSNLTFDGVFAGAIVHF